MTGDCHIRFCERLGVKFLGATHPLCKKGTTLKTTKYFDSTRTRPDRAYIKDEWIQYVIDHYEQESIQKDARIRRWAKISEMENRYLRVILLEDGDTVHNAFFDRGFQK